MYDYTYIRSIHLETTEICQAICPMCARNDVDDGNLTAQITLEQFKKWVPIDFIKTLEMVSMCGTLGDPIMAKVCYEIFEYIRKHNNTVILELHTNGSARTEQWWRKLASQHVRVIFGIDGLKDTHHLYRVNTNWSKIISNAKAFIEAGGHATWDMIVFLHNQHQIDDCYQLSLDLGFKEFHPFHTDRFGDRKNFKVWDKNKKFTHVIEPSTVPIKFYKKNDGLVTDQVDEFVSIDCKVLKERAIYISANGNLAPCCWLAVHWRKPTDHWKLDYISKGFNLPNLNEMSLQEIFNSGFFNSIEQTWTTESKCLAICKNVCGAGK